MHAAKRLRELLARSGPIIAPGVYDCISAKIAERAGFDAAFVSGAAVTASVLGYPDVGLQTMSEILSQVRNMARCVEIPLLVDIDTGWGSAFNIARTVRSMIKAGAGAVHMEDQAGAKRCGHRPGKEVVSKEEMVDRVKAAVDARTDPGFVIMARTDALAVEGLDAAIERACAYVEAGADMIFPEAMTELAMYKKFKSAVRVPILANITEFGQTPLFTTSELGSVDVDIVLYCCSAYRAMNAAALKVYQTIRSEGTQKNLIPMMQTRADLYKYLGYHDYENKLDELFAKGRQK